MIVKPQNLLQSVKGHGGAVEMQAYEVNRREADQEDYCNCKEGEEKLVGSHGLL